MSNQRAKIPMFATANNTQKWALCIDGHFGLFESKESAESLFLNALPEGEYIDNTAFGSIDILPPGFRPKNNLAKLLGEPDDMTRALLSEYTPIDVANYIRKHNSKIYLPDDPLADRCNGQFVSYARECILPFKNFFIN